MSVPRGQERIDRVREEIQRGARDERIHEQKVGKRDPGIDVAEKRWRTAIENHEKKRQR